jgi:hypothetical protein
MRYGPLPELPPESCVNTMQSTSAMAGEVVDLDFRPLGACLSDDRLLLCGILVGVGWRRIPCSRAFRSAAILSETLPYAFVRDCLRLSAESSDQR